MGVFDLFYSKDIKMKKNVMEKQKECLQKLFLY